MIIDYYIEIMQEFFLPSRTYFCTFDNIFLLNRLNYFRISFFEKDSLKKRKKKRDITRFIKYFFAFKDI